MSFRTRRTFLKATAAVAGTGSLADLGLLGPLSRAVAGETTIDPDRVRLSPDLACLVGRIRTTPRDQCVPVFIREFQAGLSYQDFLSALFLVALEHGDAHQVAQVYSAHRISSEARTEERLLPLFWVLDRLKKGFEELDGTPRPRALTGVLPSADRAAIAFRDAMANHDPDQAERAITALARSRGPRQAMARLWEHGARRVAGTLGHHPIIVANSFRTLDALGWSHAEPVLRYIARELSGSSASDRTFTPNLARIERTLPRLPVDWAGEGRDRVATLEVYRLLREGDPDATADLICSQLSSGKVKADAVWDAIHLVAADLVFRYKTGGTPIGGALIHAVTSTNALRFGFDGCGDDSVRLLLLLQGVGMLGDTFIRPSQKRVELRPLNLVELRDDPAHRTIHVADIFAGLPFKDREYVETDPRERTSSDEACRLAFAHVSDPGNVKGFEVAARTLLCVKASLDPHDIKYPAAAFEDAARVGPEWRPYLLAASVHALHGPKSHDTPALVQARDALR